MFYSICITLITLFSSIIGAEQRYLTEEEQHELGRLVDNCHEYFTTLITDKDHPNFLPLNTRKTLPSGVQVTRFPKTPLIIHLMPSCQTSQIKDTYPIILDQLRDNDLDGFVPMNINPAHLGETALAPLVAFIQTLNQRWQSFHITVSETTHEKKIRTYSFEKAISVPNRLSFSRSVIKTYDKPVYYLRYISPFEDPLEAEMY